jgi:hypothetical protein
MYAAKVLIRYLIRKINNKRTGNCRTLFTFPTRATRRREGYSVTVARFFHSLRPRGHRCTLVMNGDGEPIISSEAIIPAELDNQSHDPPPTSFNITNAPPLHLTYRSVSPPPTENTPSPSPSPDDAAATALRASKATAAKLEPGADDSSDAPPDTFVGSSEPVLTNEETQEWFPEGDHELKRVKVCSPNL